mmetsp:Transcript_17619/g.40620  ORF Transcript_17619/g.40620 Transcript_17619/m.40620 type:complete len:755 (-) Transcript_17619:445-2709(-)|eukprot:CAMPEP_0197189776 /NCGR_PEP_ID=MMETSP1423-20130617/20369_1 /TAXON_ID=476441 /ORGANISM="Pseudo-nitzschia heimii, Strain UNC1101" /LENGTH=754 /DNA_ID=CAMNT_0042641985 /DNA_START=187 /DNA_END=2451 /DNA_ORIENTATION=-
MASSPTSEETLTSEISRPISTINEDYYNSIGNTYISDTEDDDSSNASSHTPVASASPNGSTPSTTDNTRGDTATLKTTKEISSNRKTPRRPDNLLVSERSNDTKDSSSKRDTLLVSERSNETKDSSSKRDTLLVSERSNGTKDSSSKRDTTGGSRNDTLLLSERSNASYKSASRRDASGYDSLLVSETTDETWRRMVSYQEDDASSLSTTHSAPFPHLVEDSHLHMAPSPPAVPSISSHDAETAKKCGRGSFYSNQSKLVGQPLSNRIIETIESPPLSTPTDSLPSSSVPAAINITENYDPGSDGDDSQSLHGQNIEESCKTTLQNPGDPTSSDRNETGENKIEDDAIQNVGNNQSEISSIGTPRGNGRGGHVPRRWIFDRIDGTVKGSDEEEEQVPQWKRKPPSFVCLPSPLLGLFPWLLEENSCCIAFGKCGFFGGNDITKEGRAKTTTHGAEAGQNNNAASSNDSQTATSQEKVDFRRTLVMVHAFLLNVCGLFATILSGLALAQSSPGLLEIAPFGKATVMPPVSSSEVARDGDGPVILYLGLLALAVENPMDSADSSVLVAFRDFCETDGMEQFVTEEDCSRCANTSVWIVLGYFMAAMPYLPIFVMGIGRFYKNYDANCTKVASGLWSLVSISGYLLVISCYYFSCLESLYDGEVVFMKGGAVYDGMLEIPEENHLRANFEWKIGVGQILFLIGLVLKLIDFVCNCCIATPAITRSRELQWDYEEDLSLHGEKVENVNTPEGSALDRT